MVMIVIQVVCRPMSFIKAKGNRWLVSPVNFSDARRIHAYIVVYNFLRSAIMVSIASNLMHVAILQGLWSLPSSVLYRKPYTVIHSIRFVLPQPQETIQKDYSASNTRTTDNDAQFISIYTKTISNVTS